MPSIDVQLLIGDLSHPLFWICAGPVLVLLVLGLRLQSRTYWRVLVAGLVAAFGVLSFLVADDSVPVGLWAGPAGLSVLVAGLMLDRARRLRRLEQLTGRSAEE